MLTNFDNELSPGGRQTKLNYTFDRISTLMADLEEKEMSKSEVDFLKASVDDLMTQSSEHRIHMYADLSTILESIKNGLMTPEQLENLIRTEHDRSKFILHAASVIKQHLVFISDNFQKLIPVPDSNVAVTEGSVKAHVTELNLIMDQVETITKVVSTPANKLTRSAMNIIEQDLKAKNKNVEASSKAATKQNIIEETYDEDRPSPLPTRIDPKKAKGSGTTARVGVAIVSQKSSSNLMPSAPSPSSNDNRPFSPSYTPMEVKKDCRDFGVQTDRVIEKKEPISSSMPSSVMTLKDEGQPSIASTFSIDNTSPFNSPRRGSGGDGDDDGGGGGGKKKKGPKANKKKKSGKERSASPSDVSYESRTTHDPSPLNSRPATREKAQPAPSSPLPITPGAPAPSHQPQQPHHAAWAATPPPTFPSTSTPAVVAPSTRLSAGDTHPQSPRPDSPPPMPKWQAKPDDVDLKIVVSTEPTADDSEETAKLKRKLRRLEGRVVELEMALAETDRHQKIVYMPAKQADPAPAASRASTAVPVKAGGGRRSEPSSKKQPPRFIAQLESDDMAMSQVTDEDGMVVSTITGDRIGGGGGRGAAVSSPVDSLINHDLLKVKGEEFDGLEAINGVYNPHTSFTPNARDIVYSSQGRDYPMVRVALDDIGGADAGVHGDLESEGSRDIVKSYLETFSRSSLSSAAAVPPKPKSADRMNDEEGDDQLSVGSTGISRIDITSQRSAFSTSASGMKMTTRGQGQQSKQRPDDVVVFFRPEMNSKATSTDDLPATDITASEIKPSEFTTIDSKQVAPPPTAALSPTKASKKSRPLSDRKDYNFTDTCFDGSGEANEQLPTVSQSDGFVVRTYRKPVPRELESEIASASNPLIVLYETYGSLLPELFKAKLLVAAGSPVPPSNSLSSSQSKNTKDQTQSVSMASLLASTKVAFAHHCTFLQALDDMATMLLGDVGICDRIVDLVESLNGSTNVAIPSDVFRQSLTTLYQKFGEVEAKTLFVEVQLCEFRTLHEEINKLGLSTFPMLTKTCKEFGMSYNVLISCQGKMLEIKTRSTALKERCKRNYIPNLGINQQQPPQQPPQGDQQRTASAPDSTQLEQLRLYVENLRRQLSQARTEAEDLSVELFDVMQEADRTPAALQFFAALLDPSTIPSLQQLQIQLSALRGFANCSEHIDFATVRKRLNVCISTVPVMERFVQRFGHLHSKWTQTRLAIFKNRHQTGGDADGSHTCPLCNIDGRKHALLTSTSKIKPTVVTRSSIQTQQQFQPQQSQSRGQWSSPSRGSRGSRQQSRGGGQELSFSGPAGTYSMKLPALTPTDEKMLSNQSLSVSMSLPSLRHGTA